MNPIRAYRAKHGLTLEQFGELAGVQRSAVWKYENGIPPSGRTAAKIERATKGEILAASLFPDPDASVLPEPEGAAA